MPKKNIDKGRKLFKIKKDISEILVVNDKDLQPYIETINETPTNISQKKLGTFLGFFEIKEDSEDSAYIVNFLSSEAKKEYLNSKKPPIENFESTLYRVNLALSEVAKHGNINWLGNLDGAICALEGNNFHFSVTGNAKILLVRNKNLSDISQDLAPDPQNPNPIKTFENISSGKLEFGDKIIITSEDIFHVLSLSDIKKAAINFSNKKFLQFLRTALINELDIAGTLVIDIKKQEKVIPERKKQEIENKQENFQEINPFSEKTFVKKEKKNPKITKKSKVENIEKGSEYTDRNTGHIYIKANQDEKSETESAMDEFKETTNEKLSDLIHWLKNDFKKTTIKISDNIYQISKKILNWLFKFLKRECRIFYDWLKKQIKKQKIKKIKISDGLNKSNESTQPEKIKSKNASLRIKKNSLKKYLFLINQKIKKNWQKKNFKIIIPDLNKIKDIFQKTSSTQKISIFIILVLIIILPLFLNNFLQKEPQQKTQEETKSIIQSPKENLTNDKNLKKINSITDIFNTNSKAVKPIYADNFLMLITEKNIAIVPKDNKKEIVYEIPQEYGKVVLATYMKDLSLVFILTEKNRIVSFSPISKKFQTNQISLPEKSGIESISTFLTYLYVLDSKNSQIYRYPREEGGFGESETWLKDNIKIKENSQIAIDENIYISNKNQINKFFGGKKENWNIEQAQNPINFDKILAKPTLNNIYALDSANGRILVFSKEGKLISQYAHEKIKEATGFYINESENIAYLSFQNKLSYFNLQ